MPIFSRERCTALYNKISSQKSGKKTFVLSADFRIKNDLMKVCSLFFVLSHYLLARQYCSQPSKIAVNKNQFQKWYFFLTLDKKESMNFWSESLIAKFFGRPLYKGIGN